MRREDACVGMFVRLLSDWHDIPKGTVGSIDTVETEADGSWWFTIFWELHRPLHPMTPGKARPRTGFQTGSLGLRLWEEDLPRFEAIGREHRELAALLIAPLDDPSPTLLRLLDSSAEDQLTLPFADRELVEDDQAQVTYALVGAVDLVA